MQFYLYHVLDWGFADEGEDGFGAMEGQRSHASAIASNQDNGFHQLKLY